MIYILLGAAVLALAIWAGRRAMPALRGRDWRIAAGGLSGLAILGGVFAALRGGYVLGGGLIALGVAAAFSARVNPQPRKPLPTPGDTEAREMLGVSADATPDEIQAAYSRLMRMAHPDKGGTSGLAAQLNAARDRLLGR